VSESGLAILLLLAALFRFPLFLFLFPRNSFLIYLPCLEKPAVPVGVPNPREDAQTLFGT